MAARQHAEARGLGQLIIVPRWELLCLDKDVLGGR
jgi:hypothetical protein